VYLYHLANLVIRLQNLVELLHFLLLHIFVVVECLRRREEGKESFLWDSLLDCAGFVCGLVSLFLDFDADRKIF
jgi:hypothetical protein